MGVGVQREGRIGVAQDAGQRLGVHTAGEGMGGEGMAQIMESNAGQPRPLGSTGFSGFTGSGNIH